jgi:hypothetical protein
MENNNWVNESIVVQEEDATFTGPITRNWTQDDVIHGDGDQPYNISTYLPTWQTYPMISDGFPAYNWDLLSIVDARSLDAIFERNKAIFSEAYHLPDPNDAAYVEETYWSILWFADFVSPDQDPSEPVSDLYYPIIDSASQRVSVYDEDGTKEGDFVGILALLIYWADTIKDVS